ncbi:MAG: SCO1664 family protein, partial [Anaerolineae bacterium]
MGTSTERISRPYGIDAEEASLLLALRHGEIELKGQFLPGSNYTFFVHVRHGEKTRLAVYKPTRGERPLWDFPAHTLARREVAAYLVNRALGWHLVPPTVLREDAPYGPGALQAFIEHDPEYHYFTFSPADRARLRPVALFDLLVNNADRKGSHILIEQDTNRLYLIDHGLCFHVEDKLRTVIWDFAGEDIPPELLPPLEHLRNALSDPGGLRAELEPYLGPDEIAALLARAEALLRRPIFPHPPEDRRA